MCTHVLWGVITWFGCAFDDQTAVSDQDELHASLQHFLARTAADAWTAAHRGAAAARQLPLTPHPPPPSRSPSSLMQMYDDIMTFRSVLIYSDNVTA